MPHTYPCPLRWADMDLLGHVNNVTYLDYVAEAREALFAGHPAARASVARHQVEFLKPLVFHREPVLVDTWVTAVSDDEVVLTHEIYDVPAEPGSDRTVYVRATAALDHRLEQAERAIVDASGGPAYAWRPMPVVDHEPRAEYTFVVRRTDVDEHGLARPSAFFEYVQEARISYLMHLHTRGERWSTHVVGRTDIDFLAPLAHRPEPYAVLSWVAHLGDRSFTIRSEVRDGDVVLATAATVLVTFDLDTQRSTEMAAAQRLRLEQELS